MRPTPDQIAEARGWLQECASYYGTLPAARQHALTLLAATEPLTDEEIASVCAMASQSLGESREIGDLQKAHAKALEKPRGNFYASFVRYAFRHFFGPVKP